MPDLVTHTYFAKRVLEVINLDIDFHYNNVYYFGAIGPDPFFFVKFLNKKENKKSYDFGQMMHQYRTKDFLLALVEEAKNNNKVFAYLAGFITHYYLDSRSHPYVFYKTGLYNKNDSSTLKYRGLHTRLERAIDCMIIKKKYLPKYERFKISKHILKLNRLDESFKQSLDKVFKEVYNLDDAYNKVNKTIKEQKKFYKFIYDPKGIKNKIFKKFDNGISTLDYGTLSYHNKLIEDLDILNMKNLEWCNPCDNTIKTNINMIDLFDQIKDECSKCIVDVYEYLYKDKQVDLNYYFKDISYLTGLDNNSDLMMKYFDIIFN